MKIYTNSIFFIFIFMCCVFILTQIIKNNSIVDVFWSLGFVFLSINFTANAKPYLQGVHGIVTSEIITLLIFIWGLRLSVEMLIKDDNQSEDWRYINFRELWIKNKVPQWLGVFLQVFVVQSCIMFLIALPIIHMNKHFASVSGHTYIGIFIWLIGFFFEVVSDHQKFQFDMNRVNKNKIITTGLWKYSAHPNYFGECLMCWAFFVIAINFAHPVETLINLISPLVLTCLLVKIARFRMEENKFKDNEAYQQYIKNTPFFFPKFW